jgi:hypothetical protein
MKTITITCTWESTHEIEVPDDFEMSDSRLSDFPPEALEEMKPTTAELVDWE